MITTADEIRELGSVWVDAEVTGDVETLDAIATDDFRLVGPFGFVLLISVVSGRLEVT